MLVKSVAAKTQEGYGEIAFQHQLNTDRKGYYT